jgi:hypothetical protein
MGIDPPQVVPSAASEVVIIAVAVLLCSIAVTTRPAATAAKRLLSVRPITRRRLEPNARTTPLCCRDLGEARAMLADCAHILVTIGRSLIARGSRYAAILQALLVITGESPIDAAKVAPVKARTDSLDRDWVEEPAFAGAPMAGAPTARKSAV